MRMPWTLQRYIFVEMGKTFLLTAVALTGVLGLGGGIVNIVRLGDVSTGQLIHLMLLMLPVAGALTLPIAALFSAAATYGRISADNEFVACRSSGINIRLLLLPSVVLSLFCVLVTFLVTNLVIPRMARNLDQFITGDLATIIQKRLNRPQGWALGDYRLYSDHAPQVPDDPHTLVAQGLAFVQTDGSEVQKSGTAREAVLTIARHDDTLRISGYLNGIVAYDREKQMVLTDESQPIGPLDLPTPGISKLKFLQLGELAHYLRAPLEWREAKQALDQLLVEARRQHAYEALQRDWAADRELRFEAPGVTRTLQSQVANPIPGEGGLELHDVVAREERPGLILEYSAERAVLELRYSGTLTAEATLRVQLYKARLVHPEGTLGDPRKVVFSDIPLPSSTDAPDFEADIEQLLQLPAEFESRSPLMKKRIAALQARDGTVRKIIAILNERVAFSLSPLVLVVFGAVLGIVFRGTHLLTAFGISFVPSLLVFVAIAAGKQLAQNETTPWLGVLVIWGGLLVVLLLDGWTLTKVLRR